MPIDIKVPSAGESITSANIARWHKADGGSVRKGEVLVTFETDKVSTEFESPVDGVLHIIVPEGTEVPIGTVIASLTEGAVSDSPAPAPTPAPAPSPTPVPQPAPTVVAAAPVAAPIVTRTEIAPVEPVTPVHNDGRTTRKKMSMLRRKIANHLVNAQHTAAILTTFNEVDMTAVMNLRKAVQDDFTKKYQVKLGFMSFFIKAVVQALKDVPQINAMMDGTDIIENHFHDIGVAGIHRLLSRIDEIRSAAVVIVVAGMEGALPSVVGGLVSTPVIAVPTSVGYGAAFQGLAALLGMLNTCASGLTVVNIDNGFGAAMAAHRILTTNPPN